MKPRRWYWASIPAYYKTMSFVLGAFIAGIAGALYAHLNFIITPGEFGFSAAVQLLIYNVVGGTRSVYGPILGAFILTALPEVLRGAGVTAGPLRMGVNGVILLVVILYLPNGLSSFFKGEAGLSPCFSNLKRSAGPLAGSMPCPMSLLAWKAEPFTGL